MLDELIAIPTRPRDADHRNGQQTAAHQVVQRRVDLFVTQVARRPEDHQCIGIAAVHHTHHSFFSICPPNPRRMDESNLSANSARPRDSNRAYNAALSTFAGTPTSIAACTVQRPSPESDTRPPNCRSW